MTNRLNKIINAKLNDKSSRLELIQNSELRVPRKYLQQKAHKIFHLLSQKKILKKNDQRILTVVFLNTAPAKKMNLQFRGKNYATDVLSFDSLSPDSFGELIICPQVIKKQAAEHGLRFQQELLYMLIHGWLHLLGYDHEQNEKDAEIMFQIQDEIFEKLT